MGDERWTSAVWTYFERGETRTVVNCEDRVEKFSKCTLCGHQLRGHAASNNKRHLSTLHGIVDPEAQDEGRRQANPGRPEQLFLEWQQVHDRKRRILDELAASGAQPFGYPCPTPSKVARLQTPREMIASTSQKAQRRTGQTLVNVKRYRTKVADKLRQITIVKDELAELEVQASSRRTRATTLLQTSAITLSNLRCIESDPVNAFMRAFFSLRQDIPGTSSSQVDNDSYVLLDNEIAYMCSAIGRIPLWQLAEGVRRVLLNDSGNLIVQSLYDGVSKLMGYLIARVLGGIESEVLGFVAQFAVTVDDDDDDPEDKGWYQRSASAYALTGVKLWKGIYVRGCTVAQAELKLITPHEDCEVDVVLDAFRENFASAVSYDFYKSYGAICPYVSRILGANAHRLPRERVSKCTLTSSGAILEREWAFDDSSGWTVGDDTWFRVRSPLERLRQIAVEEVYINLGEPVADQGSGFHLLDFVDINFRREARELCASTITFTGFSSSVGIASEEIDKAKEFVLSVQSLSSLCFKLTTLSQFAALTENAREFPSDFETLRINLVASEVSPIDGEQFALVLAALGDRSKPIARLPTVYIDVQRATAVFAVLYPLFEMFMAGRGPAELYLAFLEVELEQLELFTFAAIHDFMVGVKDQYIAISAQRLDGTWFDVGHTPGLRQRFIRQRDDRFWCYIDYDPDQREFIFGVQPEQPFRDDQEESGPESGDE